MKVYYGYDDAKPSSMTSKMYQQYAVFNGSEKKPILLYTSSFELDYTIEVVIL